MEVKIYREPENEGLILNEDDLARYNELAAELGLCTVEDAQVNKVPSVYVCLNQAMQRQLKAICPMSTDINSYRRSTIPLPVLEVYKFCKDQKMYEGFQIWYDDVAPDPLLIGWNFQNDEAREKNYTWRRDRYLIARWGDCAMELPELLSLGFERIKQEMLDLVRKGQLKVKDVLENPDSYVRDILAGKSVSIEITTKGDGTIY